MCWEEKAYTYFENLHVLWIFLVGGTGHSSEVIVVRTVIHNQALNQGIDGWREAGFSPDFADADSRSCLTFVTTFRRSRRAASSA